MMLATKQGYILLGQTELPECAQPKLSWKSNWYSRSGIPHIYVGNSRTSICNGAFSSSASSTFNVEYEKNGEIKSRYRSCKHCLRIAPKRKYEIHGLWYGRDGQVLPVILANGLIYGRRVRIPCTMCNTSHQPSIYIDDHPLHIVDLCTTFVILRLSS